MQVYKLHIEKTRTMISEMNKNIGKHSYRCSEQKISVLKITKTH